MSRKTLKFLPIIALLFTLGCSNSNAQDMINTDNIKKIELEKYLGTWYELARYDHSFERGLVGVTANYSMRDDGKIKVLNKGFKNTLDGELSEAVGKAKIPDLNQTGKLKVSFFWFFYGDYYVMELGENYEWAIIGSSSPKYLWILSRTPQIDADLYEELLQKIRARGYDTQKLIKVDQPEK